MLWKILAFVSIVSVSCGLSLAQESQLPAASDPFGGVPAPSPQETPDEPAGDVSPATPIEGAEAGPATDLRPTVPAAAE